METCPEYSPRGSGCMASILPVPGQRGSPSPTPASLASEASKLIFFLHFAQILLPPTLVIPCPLDVSVTPTQKCAPPAGAWLLAPCTGGGSWRPTQPEKSASKFLPALPPRKGRARGVAV